MTKNEIRNKVIANIRDTLNQKGLSVSETKKGLEISIDGVYALISNAEIKYQVSNYCEE